MEESKYFEFEGVITLIQPKKYKGKHWGETVKVNRENSDKFVSFSCDDYKLVETLSEGDKVIVEFVIVGFSTNGHSGSGKNYYNDLRAVNFIKL